MQFHLYMEAIVLPIFLFPCHIRQIFYLQTTDTTLRITETHFLYTTACVYQFSSLHFPCNIKFLRVYVCVYA